MMQEEQKDEKYDVVLISVSARIPEFWTDQPALWFVQFEAAVEPQKPSDKSKYQLLIAKLGKQVIQQVADVLAKPPETGRYDALKNRLLSVYEESESRRIQKLVSDMQLGDQKPSQLLRRMQTLAGSRISEEALLVLWQNHLPATARTVLAATTLQDSEKLAAVADKILETSKPVEVAQVTGRDRDDLATAVEQLRLEVAELRRSRPRSRSLSGHRQRNTSGSKGRFQSKGPRLCFYHSRFKERATKCRKPCTWNGKDAQGN